MPRLFRLYGVVPLAVAGAMLLRWLLWPVLRGELAFLFLWPTVAFCAWWGGLGPGLLATFLSAASAAYYLMEPQFSLRVARPGDVLGTAVFVAMGVLISVLNEKLHRGRRLAERQAARVAEERERLRVTLASIGDGVLAADDAGRVVFLNPVAAELTGWPADEAVGRPFGEVFPLADEHTHRPVEAPLERVLHEGAVVSLPDNTVLKVRDGTERPIADSAAPIRDGQGRVRGVILVFRDVTEKRRLARAQERQRLEEAARLHFRTLFESVPGLFLVLKPDLTIVAASDAYLAATRTRREAILGRGLFNVFPDNPGDPGATGARNLRASLERVLQTRAADAMAVQRYDIRRPPSEGGGFEERYWSAVNAPVLGPDGEVEYLIYRVEDVTAFVRDKAAAGPAAGGADDPARVGRMEAEVYQRGRELADLNDLLRAANKALAAEIERGRERERALRESEERFRLLVGGVKDYAIFMLDPDGRISTWNAGAEAIKGYRAEEIIGQHFSRFYPRETAERGWPDQELRLAAAAGRFEEEGWRVRKDGSRFWASVVITALRDETGRLRGFAKVTRDLTERRARDEALRELHRDLERRVAERTADLAASNEALHQEVEERRRATQALSDSERRFRATFEQAAVGIAHVAPDGKWLRVNRRLCEIVGYSRAEMLERDFQAITHPDDLADDLAQVGRLLAGEIGHFAMEKRYVRKDGQAVWVNLTVALVRLPTGEPDYFISVVEDIGTRKALEQEVNRFAGRLGTLVEERTRELQEANAALEAFGYSVSHDLRTPLRNMQTLAQALQEDYGDRLDEAGRDFCQRLIRAARRMDALILDLLAYSRLSRSEILLGVTDLDAVVAEARAALGEAAPPGAVEVGGPLPPVVAHRPTVLQVVTNLLANALKFVAPGTPPRVRVWAEPRGDRVRLWVEDNGIGIAPEHRERIFQVFERLHGEETFPGTGIGLAIVRKGAERTGGRAGVESEVGRGSRFWVEWPAAGGGA